MTILEESAPLIQRIEQGLLEAIPADLPDYLKNPIYYFLSTPSKKIRPLLTLYSCQLVGGELEQAFPAAIAVELFHDFTLIHDDIMDQDELRRGRPTIHVKWGESTAILVGDALIGLAFQQLMKSPETSLVRLSQIFSETLVKVCEGQALDKKFENEKEVNLEAYLDMIHKKTAWLIQAACEMGAIVGNGTPEQVQALQRYGYFLGMGFQIQDDLLDVVADTARLGKKVGSDLLMHKKTYLTLCYRDYWEQHPDVQSRYPEDPSAFPNVLAFRQALERFQIIPKVQALIQQYFQNALQNLGQVSRLDDANPLYRITQFLLHRQY